MYLDADIFASAIANSYFFYRYTVQYTYRTVSTLFFSFSRLTLTSLSNHIIL